MVKLNLNIYLNYINHFKSCLSKLIVLMFKKIFTFEKCRQVYQMNRKGIKGTKVQFLSSSSFIVVFRALHFQD